jgi:hypothetical protein
VNPHAVHHVGKAEARARRRARSIGILEDFQPQFVRLLPLPIADGVVSMDELRKIELKLVPIAGRVRALHLAELALKACVHDPLRVERGQLADVSVMFVVDGGKQDRKRVAVLEAHAAPVADLEDALDFLVERIFVPVLVFGRVVAQPVRW